MSHALSFAATPLSSVSGREVYAGGDYTVLRGRGVLATMAGWLGVSALSHTVSPSAGNLVSKRFLVGDS